MRERYVIAGIGHTAFGKLPGRSTISLNVEASRNALADAGIPKSVVDGVFVKVPTSAHQFMYGQKVAEALGMMPRVGGAWDQGGAANITLMTMAMTAIEAGQCDVALICYADNPRSGNRAVYARPRGDDSEALLARRLLGGSPSERLVVQRPASIHFHLGFRLRSGPRSARQLKGEFNRAPEGLCEPN